MPTTPSSLARTRDLISTTAQCRRQIKDTSYSHYHKIPGPSQEWQLSNISNTKNTTVLTTPKQNTITISTQKGQTSVNTNWQDVCPLISIHVLMFFSLGNTPTGNELLPRERVYQTSKADILPNAKRIYPTGTASVLTNKTRFCVLPSNPARVLPSAKRVYLMKPRFMVYLVKLVSHFT